MKRTLFAMALFAAPMLTFAADLGNIQDLIESVGNIVDVALPIVVGIALLAFFWGLAKFIFAAGNEEKKDEGKNIMIWGAVAIFVMVSIFGIVEFIGNALDIDQGGSFQPVDVQGL